MGLLLLLLVLPELIPIVAEIALLVLAIYLIIKYWYILVVIVGLLLFIGIISNEKKKWKNLILI